MLNYLSKEEIRQWRSSLEKITLEEFARRLGKEVEEKKQTHDIVDMIVNNEAVSATPEIPPKKPAKKAINPSFTFKKKLTDREQKILDYLSKHVNQPVKATDLATLIGLPRDYVYKYIRNLRAKISEEVLVNSNEGGFLLKA